MRRGSGPSGGNSVDRHATRSADAITPGAASGLSTRFCTRTITPTICSAWTICVYSRSTWATRCRFTVGRRSSGEFGESLTMPSPTLEPTHPGAVPQLEFHTIDQQPFVALGEPIMPIRLRHGPRFEVLGFRIGKIAYCTDTNEIPSESWPRLEGLDVLILDALRHRSSPDPFFAGRGDCRRPPGGCQADLFHPHFARSFARADEPCTAARHGTGLRRAADPALGKPTLTVTCVSAAMAQWDAGRSAEGVNPGTLEHPHPVRIGSMLRCARPPLYSGGPPLGLFSAIRHTLDSLGPTPQLSSRTGLNRKRHSEVATWKLHISEFPSSDVRNAREILTRSVSEGNTSQRFESVPSLTLRVENRNVHFKLTLVRIATCNFKTYASG